MSQRGRFDREDQLLLSVPDGEGVLRRIQLYQLVRRNRVLAASDLATTAVWEANVYVR